MATKTTHRVMDDEGEGGGEEYEGLDEESLTRSPLVETPTSSANSRSKADGDDVIGTGTDGDDEGSVFDDDEELDYGGDAEGGAAVPLRRLSRKKPVKGKLGEGFVEGAHGVRGSAGSRGGGGGKHEDEDDDLVVRWSQDGGSPTSFRKLREQHERKARDSRNPSASRGDRTHLGEKRKAYHLRRGGSDRSGKETGFEELLYTPEQERRVVRRMDKYLVGFLAGLYMLSFLDRSNIGNARIAGLTEDLSLTGDQYEWLLTAFYISYIAFEWMTLLWKIVPAHKYIAFCVAGWGIIASLQAVTTTFTGLLILRFVLGIVEAAFGPGVPFYLSFFYRREELALRVGLFISAAPLATAYAGSLAFLITAIPSPLAPWRLLLIAEGFPALIVAIVAWYWIPDGPGEQWWLTPRERGIARRRVLVVKDEKEGEGSEDDGGDDGAEGGRSRWGMEYDEDQGEEMGKGGLRWKEIWRSLRDGKNWITAMIFFSCNVSFASLPVFLPTILHDMGYTSLAAQALTFPPYLLSFILVILTTLFSDRRLTRSPFLILHACLASTGYLFLAIPKTLWDPPLWLRYLAVYPICVGVFCAVALVIPWTVNNQKTATGRGMGMVVLGVVGQCGPLVGTRLFPRKEEAVTVEGAQNQEQDYAKGMAWCALAMVVVAALAWGLRRLLMRENQRRDKAWGRGRGFRYIL